MPPEELLKQLHISFTQITTLRDSLQELPTYQRIGCRRTLEEARQALQCAATIIKLVRDDSGKET